MNIEPEIIAAIIGAVAGCLAAVITIQATRKKNDAEASHSIADASAALLDPLLKRIEALERELELLRPLPGEVRRLLEGIIQLIEQIRCLGHTPVWTPDMTKRKDGRGQA